MQRVLIAPMRLCTLFFLYAGALGAEVCADKKPAAECDSVSLLQIRSSSQPSLQKRAFTGGEETAARKDSKEGPRPSSSKCVLPQLPVSVNSNDRNSALGLGFSDFKQGSPYQGLYVNKKAKVAFCLIEKNACTGWSAIFKKLQTGNLNSTHDVFLIHDTFSVAAADEVFRDPAATRAVFVRDPLERFLSAFLNKCGGAGKNPFCHMRNKTQRGSIIAFSQAVEWLKKKNTTLIAAHFNLQSRHCQLHKRLHQFTTVAVMKKNTFAQDAGCFLERAGLSHLNVKSDKSAKPFWEPGLRYSTTHAKEKSFYTKEAAEIVYKAFKEDYDLFKLPRPAWIDAAHGSLYHSVKWNAKWGTKSVEDSLANEKGLSPQQQKQRAVTSNKDDAHEKYIEKMKSRIVELTTKLTTRVEEDMLERTSKKLER